MLLSVVRISLALVSEFLLNNVSIFSHTDNLQHITTAEGLINAVISCLIR